MSRLPVPTDLRALMERLDREERELARVREALAALEEFIDSIGSPRAPSRKTQGRAR